MRPGFVLGFVLLGLGVILVVARLMGYLAGKIGQPRVVGEIVGGLILGPSVLGSKLLHWDSAPEFLHCDTSTAWMPPGSNPTTFVARDPSISQCFFPLQAQGVLSIIGQIALILFMFLVGMELNFDQLKGKFKGIFSVSAGVIVAPIIFGIGVGALLHNERFARLGPDNELPDQLAFSLFVAAMLAVTAFPVMVRILQEKQLSSSAMGVTGIAAAGLVTILMFILLGVAKGVAADYSIVDHSKIFVGTGLYLLVMTLIVKPILASTVGRDIRSRGGFESGHFAVAIIVMFGSAYAADRIGLNVIVGGFVAGIVMPERALLIKELNSRMFELTTVFLLPVFLAFSGLRTDLTTLGWAWAPGLILFLVMAVVCKWGAGALAARASGLRWSEANVLGVLMNCRGLLVLVVALEAADSGLVTPQMQAAGVIMALITTGMTGPLFNHFASKVQGDTQVASEKEELIT